MSAPLSRREALLLLGSVVALGACGRDPSTPRPVAIAFGRDACAFCRMPIEDQRLAAEFVSNRGAAALFGEAGCLLAWLARQHDVDGTVFLMSHDTGRWIDPQQAVLVRGLVRTPMAFHLAAFEARPAAITADAIVAWDALRKKGVPDVHAD